MRTTLKLWVPAVAVVLSACVAETPRELYTARTAYNRSVSTATAKLAPADLYEARRLLDAAQRAAENGEDFDEIRDLAYLALRKVELADSRARTETDWHEIIVARRALENLRAEQVKRAERDAAAAKQELSAARDRIEKEMAERDAALDAEAQANARTQRALTQQMQALSRIAPVTQEDRGTVITLSGSVLFPSGQATLLQTAMLRLDQVAEALKSTPGDQHITVEGHTDDVGTTDFNQQLSLSRAQVVRDYLVGRGIPSSRIDAYGFGASRPLVDNGSPENRANNRRVEIVIHGGPVSVR